MSTEKIINDAWEIKDRINQNSDQKIKDAINLKCFEENYKLFFSHRNNYKLHFKEDTNIDKIYHGLFKLVQYGWKREAVPVIHEKKSLIARFFDLLFN